MKSKKIRDLDVVLCLLLLAGGLGMRIYYSALAVSNYPLPTDWSEAGRIFQAASVFGKIVFGTDTPLPWLDPGRSMLEGLVLLLPGSAIWMFRLWKEILLFSTTILVAVLLVRIAWKSPTLGKQSGRFLPFLLVVWGVLYLFQAPLNYHVLLGVILVLAFYDSARPVQILILVIFASAWEGLGRINWYLMPALVACSLYFLTTPLKGRKPIKYLLPPMVWCLVGAVVSFLVYGIFLKTNGHISSLFDPAMQYHYLSFKLWPNQGYDLGLIPGMLVLSFPVGVLILWAFRKKVNSIHWLRWLGLLAILLVLFLGSTIVSLRAGGGYDLHNYDTFILIFFLVGLYFGLGSVALDTEPIAAGTPWLGKYPLLAVLLVVPVYFAFRDLPAPVVRDQAPAQIAIQDINNLIQDPSRAPGPVLFIDQRQLLVYGFVTGQEVFVPYEKIELMEMAMANNVAWLQEFHQALQDKEFSLIVSEPLTIWPQDGRAPFGYENNVYIEYVSLPILDYYLPVYLNKEVGVAIYAPIPDPEE